MAEANVFCYSLNMFIWVVVIILAVWLIVKYSRQAPSSNGVTSTSVNSNHTISEEAVFEAQNRFEKSFENTYLPDSISGIDIYLYRNLMSKWFFELSAKYRYDEKNDSEN
jgi:hypothetical protein